MCIMNLRRRSLRNKLSKLKLSPIKKPLKKKSYNRSRHLGKVSKLDLSNSGKTLSESADDFDCSRNRVRKPLLRCGRSKNCSITKDDLHIGSTVDSCDNSLIQNSFKSAKYQSVSNERKRKSTQQNNSFQNILQVKKRKENRSSTKGKEVSNYSSVSRKSFDGYLDDLNLEIPNNINSKSSTGMTTRISHRVSENNTIKCNEKSSDLSLKNAIRASPKLAAKKKIKEKEIKQNSVNNKNGQITICNSISINNLSHKVRGKRSCKASIAPKNSGINEKSIDKASVCSEAKTDNTVKQTRKKISKMTFELNQSNLQFRPNCSQYGLRQLGKKINLCDNSMGVASNNSLDYHSKTFPSLKLSRLCSERPLSGKHTIPLRKKTKKLLQRKTDVTKNSRSPSKVSSQINEFSYHLNNIPTDDLAKIPFYSPKYANKMRRNTFGNQGIVITSTPQFKKSTKQQLLKKQNKKLNDCNVSKKRAPSKGSLKEKRQLMKSLKERNEEYEDDIFENCSFSRFINLFEHDADSDTSTASIATPKCSFLIASSIPVKTPRFKDCYDPQELLKARKLAEEYMYRRNKKLKETMKKTMKKQTTPSLKKEDPLELSCDEKILGSIASTSPKNFPKNQDLDFMSVIKEYNKKMADLEKESDDDDYFSDA